MGQAEDENGKLVHAAGFGGRLAVAAFCGTVEFLSNLGVCSPAAGRRRAGRSTPTVLVSWPLCPQLRKNCCIAVSEVMGHVPTSRPLSEAREIGVTFNRELPTGRAEVL